MFESAILFLGLDGRDEALVHETAELVPFLGIRRLQLVHVFSRAPLPWEEQAGELPVEHWGSLELWVEELREQLEGVEVVAVRSMGRLHEEVVRIEDELRPDLVILGRDSAPLEARERGRRGRDILRYTSATALVVPHGTHFRRRRAVVGMDFSHAAVEALTLAIELFEEVVPVYVFELEPGMSYGGVDSEHFHRGVKQSAREHFKEHVLPRLENQVEKLGHALLRVEECRDTSRALLRVSRELEADAVVVGSHGRTRLAALLLGSTAENIVLQSHVPVLVARKARDRLGLIESLLHR